MSGINKVSTKNDDETLLPAIDKVTEYDNNVAGDRMTIEEHLE